LLSVAKGDLLKTNQFGSVFGSKLRSRTNVEGDRIIECRLNEVGIRGSTVLQSTANITLTCFQHVYAQILNFAFDTGRSGRQGLQNMRLGEYEHC